ncbi:c-type cytochrome [Parahaliea mediterranea]|uniref:C-type cytochrome n=1 Tax=Parahaliea mediterranea TaxID=651086 RepID=A0A939IK77_9GAMM|nr:c-type cytochrome [Parahaliea mediterranea]MBN7798464.1 c-type cytochrome [Parahaliea mediterranea]
MRHFGAVAGLLLALLSPPVLSQAPGPGMPALAGDADRGRLVFGQCRACHYPDPAMGHNNGPNLHRIFGKVAGKQPGFEYYSETFKQARFVWTPQLLDLWLADPGAMFPASTMMSLGVPDPQRRADLIAYLKEASVRESVAVSDPNTIDEETSND